MGEKCWECGGELDVRVGQVVFNDRLLWYRSIRCPKCGLAVEEDGIGLDDEMRAELLRRDGEWLLFVDDAASRVKGMAVVKKCLGVRYEWFAVLKGMDERCVAKGVKVEMEWMLGLMKKEGVVGSVVRES